MSSRYEMMAALNMKTSSTVLYMDYDKCAILSSLPGECSRPKMKLVDRTGDRLLFMVVNSHPCHVELLASKTPYLPHIGNLPRAPFIRETVAVESSAR